MHAIIIFLSALLLFGGVDSAIAVTVDFYLDFESGANGDTITKTILDNTTHGTGHSENGGWTTNGTASNGTISTSASKSVGSITVRGASTYSGGTRGYAYDHNTTARDNLIIFDDDHDIASFGFDITFGPHDKVGGGQNYDLFVLGSTYGNQACSLSYYSDAAGGNRVSAHQATLPVEHGDYLQIDYTKNYYVTYQWVRNGACTLKIYTKDDMALVGTSTVAISDYPVRVLSFDANGYGSNTEGITLWDNIMGEWTTNTFPLLPETLYYSVTPSVVSGSGSIAPDITENVASGSDSTTYTAIPSAGWKISSWGGTCGATGSGSTYQKTNVTEDCTITVTFTLIPSPLSGATLVGGRVVGE